LNLQIFISATFPANRAHAGHHILNLPFGSKFFRGREGQAAFAVEEFFQPPVAETALAPDDFRRDPIAHFPTKPPAFQPVFPTD
jgi:hypothetical protein